MRVIQNHPPLQGSLQVQPLKWKIGEHVAVIGTTGTGKTYLVSKLVDLRDNVVIIRTKPDDIEFDGFREFRTASAMNDWRNERLLIKPKYKDQPKVVWDVLEKVWDMGRWTIVIDEFFYVQRLGMQHPLERLLTQGRSKYISVVAGMQRPVQITRFALSEVTHLFTFKTEGRDLHTLMDSTHPDIRQYAVKLKKYQFLHYHVHTKTFRYGNAQTLSRVVQPVGRFYAEALDTAREI